MELKDRNKQLFVLLTALWAFVESGLGGFMHAFHIPFTGIFLGGFSVLVISMIAHFDSKPFSNIMQATFIVMLVKASVNPMTSPMAYIAVGFQGLMGALIYSLPFRNAFTNLSFALLCMLESAFQKLLIISIILGNSWLKAIDIYYKSISKIFGFEGDSPFSLYVVSFYVLIYLLWGILLGIWAYRLPEQIEKRGHLYRDLQPETLKNTDKKKKGRKPFTLMVIIGLLIISFYIGERSPLFDSLIILLRVTLVVMIWMLLILPLWKYVVRKYLLKKKSEHLNIVMSYMPYISDRVKPLYRLLKQRYKGLKKWKEFVIGLMVISLNRDMDDEQNLHTER